MRVLIVDWLGRGGIAHSSEAWALELAASSVDARIVTRGGRELTGPGPGSVVAAPPRSGRLAAHWGVARTAARLIRSWRPAAVVVQNYLVPPLETPVYLAARAVGARTVLVVHDHRLHVRAAGLHLGLGGLVRGADSVVVHTSFVGDALRRQFGRSELVHVPLPVPVGLLARPRPESQPIPEEDSPLAIHFGILNREYKGTSVVLALARRGVPPWRFAAVGVGAPEQPPPGLTSLPGFAEPGSLVSAVAGSAATLLPYRKASQSGAVVLAQAVGSVPVSTGVGGLAEQIRDGVDGRVLPQDAPVDAWREALDDLQDPATRRAMASRGRSRVWADHALFRSEIRRLVA